MFRCWIAPLDKSLYPTNKMTGIFRFCTKFWYLPIFTSGIWYFWYFLPGSRDFPIFFRDSGILPPYNTPRLAKTDMKLMPAWKHACNTCLIFPPSYFLNSDRTTLFGCRCLDIWHSKVGDEGTTNGVTLSERLSHPRRTAVISEIFLRLGLYFAKFIFY